MTETDRAIETLRKISDIETSHQYGELHEIKTFNYDLLTALEALKEKQERESPKPLTLDELRQMDGEPVWIKSFMGGEHDGWMLSADSQDYIVEVGGWLYRHKPIEEE